MKKVIGYKAFNGGLKCRDFQYEIGKDYKLDGEIGICSNGFHFCKNPLDILTYYPLLQNNKLTEFGIIEAFGKVQDDENKSVTDGIRITAKLDLPALVKASVDFIWNKASKKSIFKNTSATSGEYAHSATSGYGAHSATSGHGAHSATSGNDAHSATSGNDAHSATSGEYAHSATSGNRANSATSGYGAHSATSTSDAIACSIGRKAKAKASLGSWIVIAEWKEGYNFEDAKPLCVLSAKVDDKKIKADQWYKVVDKKFVETDDSNE